MKRNARGSIWKRVAMTASLLAAILVLSTCNMEFKPEDRILSIEPSTGRVEFTRISHELAITKEMLRAAGLEGVVVRYLKSPPKTVSITDANLEILDAQGNAGDVKVIAGKNDQRLTLRYSNNEMKLSADVEIEVVYKNRYSIEEQNLSIGLEGPDPSADINDIGILIDGNNALTVTEGALSKITLLGPGEGDRKTIGSDELKTKVRILSSEADRVIGNGESKAIEWLYDSGEGYDAAFRTTVSYTSQDRLLRVEPSAAGVALAGFSESLGVTDLSQLRAGYEGVTHKVEGGVASLRAVYSATGERDIPADAWPDIRNEAGSTAVSTGERRDISFRYTDGGGLSVAFAVSVEYEAIVSTPDIDEEPDEGGYSVRLGSATSDCEIWYTTDGTEPAREGLSSRLYGGEFHVTGTEVTVKAIGCKERWRPSEVRTLVLGTGRLDRPVFDKPDGFTAAGGLTVSISGRDGETIVWETQSGRSGSGLSPQSVVLDRNDRISAVARKDGFKDSFSVSRSYNVQILKPEGLIQDIEGGRRVKLSTATAGAVIYYTTNGEAPTSSSIPYPEGGIEFTDAVECELKAVAVKENLTDSDIYEQTVTVARADSPSFNQADGTVKEWSAVGESLTVSSSAGISLYVDSGSGFAPAESPHSINGIKRNTQIKAYAVKTGMARSEEVSCTLKIKVSKPAIEAFTDGEGLTRVRISCLTDAAQIRFTSHNGSDSNPAIPDESSTLYTGGEAGLIVDGAMSYRAIAFAPGLEASDSTEPFGVQAGSISPTFSEAGGHVFTGEGSVVIDTSPAGGRIRYRIDSEQQWSSWENAPVIVTLYRNAALHAEANKDHFVNNSLSREYKVRVPAPVPSLEAVLGGADLTFGEISVGDPSSPGTARIVYRTDGAEIVSESAPGVTAYSSAVEIRDDATNVTARAYSDGMEPSETVAVAGLPITKVGKPVISPVGGEFENSIESMTITGAEGTSIVYHVNGVLGATPEMNPNNVSVPSTDSFTDGTVVKAYARKAGFADSDEAQEVYGFKAARPVITPDSDDPTTLSITSSTSSAVIMVALGDTESEPDEGSFSPMPGSSYESENGKWVWAFAKKDGYRKSDVASHRINVDQTPPPHISPEANPGGHEKEVVVTISTPAGIDPGTVSLYYRLGEDGDETPIANGGTLTIRENGVHLYAWAKQAGKTKSEPAERTYTILAQAPTIGEPEDIQGGRKVRITAPEGVTAYYTTDGTAPGSSSPNSIASGSYEELSLMTANTHVIKAISYAAGKLPSTVVSRDVAVEEAARPTFSPAPSGTYSSPLDVAVTQSEGGDIHYATGSSDPGKGSYIKLTGNTITLDSTSHIYAFARQMGKADSDVADSGRYVFASEAPQITEENIIGGKKARIIAPGGSGVVRYTTDGQDPDSATPTTVAAGQTREIELKNAGVHTIKARFFADDGVSHSSVAAKTITVSQLQSPMINVSPDPWEGDKYDSSVTADFQSPNATKYLYTTESGEPNTEGNNATITQSSTLKVKAQGMGYVDSPIATRTFTLKLQKPTITEKEKIDEGIIYTISCASSGAALYCSAGGGDPNETVPLNGEVTVTDTATLKAVARKDGFADSDIASQSVSIPLSSNVTFDPAGGTYNAEKAVSLSAGSGAKIYYTTDSTDPSPNTGTTQLYSNSPIAVNESRTIKAMAIEPGKKRSAVQSAVYTLKAPELAESAIAVGATQITVTVPSGFTVKYKKQGTANWTTYTVPFEKEIGTYIFVLTREGWTDGDEKTKVVEPFPYEMVEVEGGTMNLKGTDVTLTGFCMGKYEVTQELYEEVMENHEWGLSNKPSSFSDNPASGENQKKRPVEMVSWYNAVAFANKLSEKNGFDKYYNFEQIDEVPFAIGFKVTTNPGANGYRLPTTAEWEYAARGGTLSRGYTYSGSNDVDAVAWYADNSGEKTHEVGKKAANELGLYDMSGNVWEWCWDSTGGSFSYNRLCGGCWESSDTYIDPTHIGALNIPSGNNNISGFRLVRSL